jgi:hypothetical protein
VGGVVALTGLAIASTLIRVREERAEQSAAAFGDGAAWSANRCS